MPVVNIKKHVFDKHDLSKSLGFHSGQKNSSGLQVLQNKANVNIINIHGLQHYGYYPYHRMNPIPPRTPRRAAGILISLCSGDASA